MKMITPSRLLRTALLADAAVSGSVAVVQLAATNALVGWLALPRALLVETGIFLVAYTVVLALLARSGRVPAALIGLIVAGNLGWAAGCVGLLASDRVVPSGLGTAFVLLQAVTVIGFAALEYVGLKASRPAAAPYAAQAR